MKVHVRKLTGPFFWVEMGPADTVAVFRKIVEEGLGKSLQGHRLSFEGRQLDQDERLVVSYGVTEGSTVILVGP